MCYYVFCGKVKAFYVDMVSIRRIKALGMVLRVLIVWNHVYFRALDGSRLLSLSDGIQYKPSQVKFE